MRKIVLTLVSFLVALPALAEEVKKTFVQEVNKTSTATLVASALESAGYKAQEIVLKQFHEELILLASLVFVCCAIRGMFSILLDKKYLPVLWMVTGPVIFLVLINATTKADAVDWQFAKEKKENEVKEVLEGTENKEVKESAKGSEVSWFFHEYNRMVSAIIQEIIETLSNDSAKNHYIFTIRQQLFSEMLSSDLLQTDQGMQYFVRDTVAICADVMERARLIAMKRRENLNNDEKKNNEIKAMIDEYNKKLKSNERVNLGDVKGPYLQKVFNQIRTEDSPQFKTKYFEAVKGTLNNYLGFDNALEKAFDSDGEALSALKNEGFTNFEMLSVNCEQSWVLMNIALTNLALKEIMSLEKTIGREIIKYDEKEKGNLIRKIYEDLLTKLTNAPNFEKPGEAQKNVKQKDLTLLPISISGYTLRNYITKHGKTFPFLNSFRQNQGMQYLSTTYNIKADEDLASDLHGATVALKEKTYAVKRNELFAYTMSIPYLQGVILYVLSLTFPFFALVVLVPGRANFFFTWMVLWAWVKSWDVGWAAVMIVDKVLWELMPHSSVYDWTRDPNHGPLTVMESAFRGDYAYSQDQYMTLISFLVMAVPILMAKLILMGKGAGFAELANKFKRHSGIKTVEDTTSLVKGMELSSRACFYRELQVLNAYCNEADRLLQGVANIKDEAGIRAFINSESAKLIADGFSGDDINMITGHLENSIKDMTKGKEAKELGIGLTSAGMVAGGMGIPGSSLLTLTGMKYLRQGVELGRQGNEQDMQVVNTVMRLAQWKTQNSDMYKRLEGLRAAMNNRVEGFGLPDTPYEEFIRSTFAKDEHEAKRSVVENTWLRAFNISPK